MKPSIFSREYEKRMRRRRNIIVTLIVIMLITAGTIFVGGKLNINSTFASAYKKGVAFFGNIHINMGKNKEQKSNKTEQDRQTSNINNEQSKTQTKKDEEKYYEVNFNGLKAKAVYEDNGGNKKFEFLTFDDGSKIEYNINPLGNGIVLIENSSQSIYYIDINGKLSNISYETYTSSDNTVFKRDEVLKNNPDYIWCAYPKFVDEKNIVYITQIPWFDNRATKYVWSINTDSKTHVMVRGIEGDNIKFGNIGEKGLEVTVDDKAMNLKYLSDEGVVVK